MTEPMVPRQVEIDDFSLRRARRRSLVEVGVLYGACVVAALTLAAMLVAVSGGSWVEVLGALIDGSVRKPGRIGATVGTTVPILVVALGAIVSAKAGLVNIGQEGQLLVGAALCTYVALRTPGPGVLVLVVALVAGGVGGALWAGIAAMLRYRRGVPEVLTTLLLVTVAVQLVGYGLKHESLLLAPSGERAARNQVSAQLEADTRLPRVAWFGNEWPSSALIAVAAAVAVAFVFARTLPGMRVRMLGRNPKVAQRVGVDAARYGTAAMLVSGGFAGFAGALMLVGGDFGNYQLVPGFAVDIGWTGLLVALVARERALVAIPMAFVFGALRTGSGFVAATGVERRVTDVVQALLVLALLLPPAILYVRERRRAAAAIAVRV